MKSNKFLALALILTAVFLKDGQCAVRFGRKKPVLGSLDTELPINPAVSVHKTPGNDGISMEKAIQAVQRDCEEFRLDCDFGNASEFLNANAGKLPKTLDAIVKDVFNHLGINSTKLMKKNKRKKRRAMVNREENLWGLGQIPYIWDASSPYTSPGDPRYDNHIRQLIEGNMAKISSQTCITFHRWYNGIEEKHEGMKPGRLLIGSYRGCWSQVGYHGNQFISPCKSGAAMQHELAHAIGLSHEHRSPDSNKYIKSYPKNWGSGLRNDWSTLYLFTMTDYYSNFNITFDLSSGMIGSIPRRGATNRIVYDTLDKNARYLNSGSDLGLNFRDYKSINLGYKCFERFCKGQTLTCENEGYPAYAGGKCKCSCPRGLAGDRCEQVTTVPESTEWPSGNYGLPMPVDTGCPAGTWATGQRVHLNDQGSTTFSSGTPELRPQWRSENASNVYFDFCIKKGTEETQKLPRGTYCVYKVGDSCPSGPWEDGSLQYLGGSGVSKSGTLPSGSFTDTETMLEYCCRFDRQGTYAEPMIFPHTKPFYLFSPTSSCQEVHGMIHKRQSVWMKISNFTIVEPIPHHSVSSESVYMYLCYYYPKTDGHGEVFELTPEKPEKIITSHGYPIKYQRGLQQYWLAKVPEGGLVQLDLQVFDVYYNTEDGQCIDYMETTVYGIDQNGKREVTANGL